uniref:Uncharacterized protein n=1 Tax=Sphaerodactylus townsendi TaxID=933632 RepID=A0ACB8E7X6_9SAUR
MLAEYTQKKESLQENIEKSKIGRQNTAERAALTKELTALRQKKDQLKLEIETYKECDPDVIEEILPSHPQTPGKLIAADDYKEIQIPRSSRIPHVKCPMRQANKVAKEAANRWTDNIFSVKSWAKRKFGFEDSKINKTFGIPEDFDYVD